ncbi:ankyrin repeat-containing protein BDA1-like [Hibiscus syriacus]|uniref:ankyrin repeat-containing protein BDA1-like n=1 Tax=Hibiscus syriacus TaxID=106335 RepID=UPI0019214272|nr:ankyrin repeat-containing protein BDA1-like [Hibiscus syriacus]
MEMLNLKPSFAKKLNREGFRSMHLAVRNGKTKLVHLLLKAVKDLARVKGWKGMIPFHHAATTGNSKLLFEFLEACPESIEDDTIRGETALHLSLKHDDVEAFKLQLGWLQRSRTETMSDSYILLDVKAKNWEDSTALEVIQKVQGRGDNKITVTDDDDSKIKRLKRKLTLSRDVV